LLLCRKHPLHSPAALANPNLLHHPSLPHNHNHRPPSSQSCQHITTVNSIIITPHLHHLTHRRIIIMAADRGERLACPTPKTHIDSFEESEA
jgi:hypothetical protein